MASFSVSSAVLATLYDRVVRQTMRDAKTLKFLQVRAGKGSSVNIAVESDGQLAGPIVPGADVADADFGHDAQLSGSLQWGTYGAPIKVDSLAMDAAASVGNPADNNELFMRQIQNASKKLVRELSEDLFGGDGYLQNSTTHELCGLNWWVGDTTSTVAGISRVDNSFFRPTVTDPGTLTALTMDQISGDLASIFKACGSRPDLGVCSPSVMLKIKNLFLANRRWVDDVSRVLGGIKLDGGVDVVVIDGCTFIEDPYCDESTIYYLNRDHVYLSALQAHMVPQLYSESLMVADALPLLWRITPLATTGYAKKAALDVTLQVVCDRPNACGARKNVAI